MRYWIIIVAAAWLGGCLGPDYARVADRLREQNLKLEQELGKTRRELGDRDATIQTLKDKASGPRVETLPAERLREMFVMDSVEIQGSTDAWNFSGKGQGQEGFRVFVRTKDAGGDVMPFGGTLTVEAFDLAVAEGSQRLGTWMFTPAEVKKSWYGMLGLNHFAVNCPWKTPPAHREITFKVRFVEALTGNAFADQKVVKVHLEGK